VTKEEWEEYLKRSRTWSIRIGHELLHSTAYQSLKYAPSVKVLNWFYEKVRYAVDKRKRGKERYRLLNEGEMSFTYSEAEMRGLTHKKFSRALKELVGFGFIDVVRLGSGLQGDYSLFVFSQRWRKYGTDHFDNVEFPRAVDFGFRRSQKQRPKTAVGKGLQRPICAVEKPGFA
jgi:hypothetical protein